MAITAVWSPLHGAYTTANTLALAVCMAEGHETKTLVTQTHFSLNNLEMPLIGRSTISKDELFTDIGLDAATRLYKANSFGLIESATIPIGGETDTALSLLPGTTKRSREIFDNDEERLLLKRVIRELARYYTEVLIDTNAGYGDQTMAVLEAADNIVICLRQNRQMIEDVLANEQIKPLLEKKKVFYLFGEYDSLSKMSLQNLRKIFRSSFSKSNLGAVPYNIGYRDAISDCTAYSYLIRTIDLYDPKEEDADDWWYEVDQFVEKLM